MNTIKNCSVCKKPFLPKRHDSKCCTVDCAKNAAVQGRFKNLIKCEKCYQTLTIVGYKNHLKSCNGKQILQKKKNNKKLYYDYILEENELHSCNHCNLSFETRQLASYHVWKHHTEEGKNHNPVEDLETGQRIIWSKGLTKETNSSLLSISEKLKLRPGAFTGKHHSLETKEKLSELAFSNKLGGRFYSKKINYETIDKSIVILESSWEYKVARSLDENNIKWIRPKHMYWIDSNNKKHRYYADFYLPDYDLYLDPKNPYVVSNSLDKIKRVIEQNQITLFILNKDELNWNCILEKYKIWSEGRDSNPLRQLL